MGAVGPVATVFLAWAVLEERPHALPALGLAFAITGGLAITLGQKATRPPKGDSTNQR